MKGGTTRTDRHPYMNVAKRAERSNSVGFDVTVASASFSPSCHGGSPLLTHRIVGT